MLNGRRHISTRKLINKLYLILLDLSSNQVKWDVYNHEAIQINKYFIGDASHFDAMAMEEGIYPLESS
jgi:hypothetical protein